VIALIVYCAGGTTVLSISLLKGQATLYLSKALIILLERAR
jgi:hypothetical protein